jgi:hypothetical protein
MGNSIAHNIIEPINYNCPVCINSGKLPNIAGRFFLINEQECQCNGCSTKFPKEQFYKNVQHDTVNCK